MLRRILQFILKILAKLVLLKYRPIIVAVTGSVGKTSTKEAIYAVLRNHFGEGQVRRNEQNYNNEIGVPLTIFGLETGGRSIACWFVRFVRIFLILIFKEKYPRILIVEMGADRPGDIKYLTRFVKAKIGVITAIGEIPAHVEFFESPQQVTLEKKRLIDSLKPASSAGRPNGTAILNYDDEIVRQMGQTVAAEVLTYGFEKGADIRATNYEIKTADLEQEGILGFINFKLDYKGSIVPVKLINVLGKHQVYPALAAAAVGIIFNLNLVEISEGLRSYKSLPGRMRLLKGVKNTLIIDDTYNAAPLATLAALETLGKFEERRKIAVLGDMLEIGKYTPEVHQRIGKKAAETADLLFTVGQRAKFIAKGAQERDIAKDRIFEFYTSDEVGKPLQALIKQGDIILIKASRAMKMEKIVKEIMAEPRRAKRLLVQD